MLNLGCKVKILVVHHSRRSNDAFIYLSDDFKVANNQVYGAQELDTWAGIRMLARDNELWRLEICPNESLVRLFSPSGDVLAKSEIRFDTGLHSLSDIEYLKALFRFCDSSIAFFSRKNLVTWMHALFQQNHFDLLWWETQFYEALIPNQPRSIVRSVNFEPVHVLAEDPSPLRYLRFLSKVRSERLISRTRELVAISPNDQSNYMAYGANETKVLPLRQLPFISNSNFATEDFKEYFLFFGSNYNIYHNRRNLQYILEVISPGMRRAGLKSKIATFGHRIPSEFDLPDNVIHFGFADNLQGKQLGSLGIVIPFHGGAGMQSKIFEPLILGVPVIANPKNFAGYDFQPYVHYHPATSENEYINAMVHFEQNAVDAWKMGERAKIRALELFSESHFFPILNGILYDG